MYILCLFIYILLENTSVELFILHFCFMSDALCFGNFRRHCSSGFRQVAVEWAGDHSPTLLDIRTVIIKTYFGISEWMILSVRPTVLRCRCIAVYCR